MKKFEITYTDVCYVTVEADTEEEALEKFMNGNYDESTRKVEGYQDPEINREM